MKIVFLQQPQQPLKYQMKLYAKQVNITNGEGKYMDSVYWAKAIMHYSEMASILYNQLL